MALKGVNRLLRGGSWNNNPVNVRASNRGNNTPSNRNNNNGFRLAKSTHLPVPARLRMPGPALIKGLSKCRMPASRPFSGSNMCSGPRGIGNEDPGPGLE